jgi:hypothetical protein
MVCYYVSAREVQFQGLRPQVHIASGQPPEIPGGHWPRSCNSLQALPTSLSASRLGPYIFQVFKISKDFNFNPIFVYVKIALILQYTYLCTLQRKSHLCIPFLGITWPKSQFPHSCVCERFIYSHYRSAYSATGNMRQYINRSQKRNT